MVHGRVKYHFRVGIGTCGRVNDDGHVVAIYLDNHILQPVAVNVPHRHGVHLPTDLEAVGPGRRASIDIFHRPVPGVKILTGQGDNG